MQGAIYIACLLLDTSRAYLSRWNFERSLKGGVTGVSFSGGIKVYKNKYIFYLFFCLLFERYARDASFQRRSKYRLERYTRDIG